MNKILIVLVVFSITSSLVIPRVEEIMSVLGHNITISKWRIFHGIRCVSFCRSGLKCRIAAYGLNSTCRCADCPMPGVSTIATPETEEPTYPDETTTIKSSTLGFNLESSTETPS